MATNENERLIDATIARLAARPEARAPAHAARRFARKRASEFEPLDQPGATARRTPMKIAYVVPRYGLEVRGGAEHASRMLAERLTANGWDVHVFTTCALDARTWSNHYPAASTDINGVSVHRYASTAGRSPEFHDFASALLVNPATATDAECTRFMELQGPVCPDAIDAAVESDAQLLIFYPYLYSPTVDGVPRAGPRAVMHPAAHDEPALRLPIFRGVFSQPSGLVFQTFAERDLCERMFGAASTHHIVLGLGVDEYDPPAPGAGRREIGLGDEPFLLYVGRLEDGKGTGVLVELFAEYKARHPGPLKLVLAGSSEQAPAAHSDVVTPGPVPEETKRALMAECLAFVQPSFFEAFSLVLVEAWMAGAPALVNGTCGPLREHCERSGGGLCFDSYASFDAALTRLVDDTRERSEMSRRGHAYVQRNFAWPSLIARYEQFLTSVAVKARA